jgi:hypothetical protein
MLNNALTFKCSEQYNFTQTLHQKAEHLKTETLQRERPIRFTSTSFGVSAYYSNIIKWSCLMVTIKLTCL